MKNFWFKGDSIKEENVECNHVRDSFLRGRVKDLSLNASAILIPWETSNGKVFLSMVKEDGGEWRHSVISPTFL